jgi:hypothetical protein
MTYAELVDQIADWLNRDDLTAVAPTFVSLAEASLGRRLRVRQMLASTPLDVTSEYEDLPDDYREHRVVSIETAGGPVPLRYVTPDRAVLLKTADAGQPQFFTVEGSRLRYIRPPDTNYGGTLLYYAALPALSNAVPTNWLLTDAPDIYLYGALLEATPYLKDDGRVPVWEKQFENRIRDLIAESERSQYGGGPLVPLPSRRTFD